MRLQLVRLVLLATLLAATSATCQVAGNSAPMPSPHQREIAITIDDLPAASPSMTAAETTSMTIKLLSTLKQQNVPAIGFVNEKKLFRKWGEVDERINALNMWLDAGFDLGNHTYAHTSLNQASLHDFEESVVRGETITSLLLAEHGKKLRYFRYPYLDTGRDLETRRSAEAFLVSRDYRVAPVTMDAWDWNFAGIYDEAKRRGDQALQHEIVDSYLAYHTEVFNYYEKLSKNVLGYEPKQILLLHASNLEAEHISDLINLLRKRGYSFITLENALSDPAYSIPDTIPGEESGGSIERWAISHGQTLQDAPVFPPAMAERAKLAHERQP